MEREHLIIIALILVAIYMMNKDDSMDSVKSVTPMGHIRTEVGPFGHIRTEENLPSGVGPLGHIRYKSHEGFEAEDPANASGKGYEHIRYSDKYIGRAQHIKNSIRYDNRNNMFNGMFAGAPSHNIRTVDCSTMPC
jgi:hypothetical protein